VVIPPCASRKFKRGRGCAKPLIRKKTKETWKRKRGGPPTKKIKEERGKGAILVWGEGTTLRMGSGWPALSQNYKERVQGRGEKKKEKFSTKEKKRKKPRPSYNIEKESHFGAGRKKEGKGVCHKKKCQSKKIDLIFVSDGKDDFKKRDAPAITGGGKRHAGVSEKERRGGGRLGRGAVCRLRGNLDH